MRRLNLLTGDLTEIFRSEPGFYERVVDVLASDGSRMITVRESLATPQNYFLRFSDGSERALTAYQDLAPILREITIRRLVYHRVDGVQLSCKLYFPQDIAIWPKIACRSLGVSQELGQPLRPGKSGAAYEQTHDN
ncbi:MAG: hypothetical protein U5J83_02905 [Bryobacterales bacterium]|nr:hypothetical protein [Bryobacterales bacterium]